MPKQRQRSVFHEMFKSSRDNTPRSSCSSSAVSTREAAAHDRKQKPNKFPRRSPSTASTREAVLHDNKHRLDNFTTKRSQPETLEPPDSVPRANVARDTHSDSEKERESENYKENESENDTTGTVKLTNSQSSDIAGLTLRLSMDAWNRTPSPNPSRKQSKSCENLLPTPLAALSPLQSSLAKGATATKTSSSIPRPTPLSLRLSPSKQDAAAEDRPTFAPLSSERTSLGTGMRTLDNNALQSSTPERTRAGASSKVSLDISAQRRGQDSNINLTMSDCSQVYPLPPLQILKPYSGFADTTADSKRPTPSCTSDIHTKFLDPPPPAAPSRTATPPPGPITTTSPPPPPAAPSRTASPPSAPTLASSTFSTSTPITPTPQPPPPNNPIHSLGQTVRHGIQIWGWKRWCCCACGLETHWENGVCSNLMCYNPAMHGVNGAQGPREMKGIEWRKERCARCAVFGV
ncbi:hypothetical protein K432DRAFT_445966 [Lepidopterella palustris CBS 459.81]|uniref:Uncharacterized protein n=1 Tax=Lepidopterella palustris CBS 459.81 TaxID=1314670 RepID=A0A8E2JBL1_9PEZI|nr:hypothetical protein K432DRAFT_445966 [Lepidopterella palustris CBS 459.81]